MKPAEVEGLRFSYREREVLRGVTFSVARGELFGLLGPNGGGKTRVAAGLPSLGLSLAVTAGFAAAGFAASAALARRRSAASGGELSCLRAVCRKIGARRATRYFAGGGAHP